MIIRFHRDNSVLCQLGHVYFLLVLAVSDKHSWCLYNKEI